MTETSSLAGANSGTFSFNAWRSWASPRRGWSYIQKINKVSVTVLDNWGNGGVNFTRTIPFDKLTAEMTAAEVLARRSAGMLNEVSDGTGFYLGPTSEDPAYSDQLLRQTPSISPGVFVLIYRLGLMLTVFVLNGFLNFIDQPPRMNPLAIQFFVAISASQFAAFFFAVQLIGRLLFALRLLRTYALTLLVAELHNILALQRTFPALTRHGFGSSGRIFGNWCVTAIVELLLIGRSSD